MKRGSVTVETKNETVLLVMAVEGGAPSVVCLPPPRARELARMLLNAADFAEAAAMGPVQGTA